MSLCAACGHNSVFHVNGGCAGHLQDEPTERMSLARIYREKPVCDCTLERWDPEFRAHTDERGFLLPGHAAYREETT